MTIRVFAKHITKGLIIFSGLLLLSGCSPSCRYEVDALNSCAYALHYKDLDSAEMVASRALALSCGYESGRAEALNNLVFVDIIRMDYPQACTRLDSIEAITDNQVELLVASVQRMRLCQRMAKNREFYEYRDKALRHLRRISEERSMLTSRLQQRTAYAESELAIVTSTYYYYVGLSQQSDQALSSIDDNDVLRLDTAQYLNYLYNVGLMEQCLSLAEQSGYVFFEANALEAIGEKNIGVNDSLSLALCQRSLDLFSNYGDVYQVAAAHRSLASCHMGVANYETALYHLGEALVDERIEQAPDLCASIHEQLCVCYSALDDKQQSDLNRNIYLDLQEKSRQDRYYEARAAQLNKQVRQLNIMIVALIVLILFLLFILWLIHTRMGEDRRKEALEEQMALAMARHRDTSIRNLEHRAKLQLATRVTPLLNRIINELHHLDKRCEPEEVKKERLLYVNELSTTIESYNALLTDWIQMRQGTLSLKIETFPLAQVFNMVRQSVAYFSFQGISLNVDDTKATVKADRVLTLFMINTLADNSRKFTPSGGSVHIYANELAEYVEISVADTGKGFTDNPLTTNVRTDTLSHGFGLRNCEGIMDKYRKTSHRFSCCTLGAESIPGQGCRFFFRLLRGGIATLIAFFIMVADLQATAANEKDSSLFSLHTSLNLADSVYYANINGQYEKALLYADSCKAVLSQIDEKDDAYYTTLLDVLNESAVAALALHEWDLYRTNNQAFIHLYKELSADNTLETYCNTMTETRHNRNIAIVMLLLVFAIIFPAYYFLYYRRIVTNRLLMEETAEEYISRLDTESDNMYVCNSLLDNCLSTLKHETMYYPSRIRQLVKDNQPTRQILDVAIYYRNLYDILTLQAIRQLEKIHIQTETIAIEGTPSLFVIANYDLLQYMLGLLRKQSGRGDILHSVTAPDELYVVLTLRVPTMKPLPFLLCSQVMRDLSELSGRRRCGIRRTDTPYLEITLPRCMHPAHPDTAKSISI